MDIRELLASAVERGASDLHLSAGLPPMVRIDGDVVPFGHDSLSSDRIRGWIDDIAGSSVNDTRQDTTGTSVSRWNRWAASGSTFSTNCGVPVPCSASYRLRFLAWKIWV